MDLDLSPDQKELQAAVLRMAEPYQAAPAGDTSYFLDGEALYEKIETGGFLRAAAMEEYGALGGVLLLEAASALPFSVALSGAALVAPMTVDEELAGPVAMAFSGRSEVVRHLSVARTLLIVGNEEVFALDLAGTQVEPLKSIFADPYGAISEYKMKQARPLKDVRPADVARWWSVAVATEIGGAAGAAVARTVEFVKMRRQFGRPIGSYQAIQHRLAECEVLVNATRMLARRAAVTGDAAAAFVAATHAEAAAGRIAYDTQQFHGAAGLTREVELHFFTYRLRALQGELATINSSPLRASDLLWPRERKSSDGKDAEKRLVA